MPPLALALLFLTTCSIFAQSMQPADLWKLPVTVAGRKLAYGSDPLQFGELRLPKAKGQSPIVILVHGGCWMDRLPNRDPRDTSLEPLHPLAAALADAGVATWNVEYRRSGHPGGGWPGSFLDLSAAVDFLRTIAPAHNLDLTRVIVLGHSSGGQLAHWIAARPKLRPSSPLYTKQPLRIKAVVNLDGPPELTTAQPIESKFCPVPGVSHFMGGPAAEQPERYREGSALGLLPIGVPQVIVSGALLQHAPDLVSTYQAAAQAQGDAVRVLKLEGAGHFDMLMPESQHGKTVLDAVLALLK